MRKVATYERELGNVVEVLGLRVGIRGQEFHTENAVGEIQERVNADGRFAQTLFLAGIISRLDSGHGYVAIDLEQNVLIVPNDELGAAFRNRDFFIPIP